MQEPKYVPLPIPGSIVGKFYLLREIGKGGMGSVFEAVHLDNGRRVALKVTMETDLGAQGVLREIHALQLPIDSPHVVRYVGSGTYFADEAGIEMPWVALELLQGVALDKLVKERGPLQLSMALEIAIQVGKGLLEVHRHGVLHRDVKPPNIFVSFLSEGRLHIRLIDFGIACKVDEQREGLDGDHTFGTPAYMSPEQIHGNDTDVSVDGYGLALTFLFMLLGRKARVFPGDRVDFGLALNYCQPETIARQLADLDLPPQLEATLASMLAWSPKGRCTLEESLAVFEQVLRAQPPPKVEVHNELPARTNHPRWPARVAGLVLTLLVSMAAAYVAARQPSTSPVHVAARRPDLPSVGTTPPSVGTTPPQPTASGLLPNGKPPSSLVQSGTVGSGVKPRPERRVRPHRPHRERHAPSRPRRRRHRSRVPF